MSTAFQEIGDRVRRLRRAAGQTQEEFAETVGISLRSLKGYETGARELPTSAILQLCELTRVSPSWIILGRKDDLDPDTIGLLQQSLVSGLELLRKHSPDASSENWAQFLGILMKMSHGKGVPLSHQDSKDIFELKDKL